MNTLSQRRPAAATVFVAFLIATTVLLLALAACGGSSNSSSSTGTNTGGTNSGGITPGSSNPGSTGSGGSGGSTGGGTGTSTKAAFVYASVYTNAGGVVGYSQNSSAMLTSVSGSPYQLQGSSAGSALAAVNGYVYAPNMPGTQSMPSNSAQLNIFKADSSTGALSQIGTAPAVNSSSGDNSMRRLQVNSTKNVMYGVFQRTINSYSLSNNASPELIQSTAPSTDSVWGFDFMPNGPYAYAAIQNGNPKQGFQIPQIHLLNMATDGSLTDNRAVVTLSTASGIAGYLVVDPTGKYVVVTNGQQNDSLSVFAIQSDGSLNEVSGSPFSTGTQNLGLMTFDSSGKFLYVVSNALYEPRPENLQVFSFNPSTGALSQIQNMTEPNEFMESWLKVDGNYLYLTNVAGNGLSSTITIYNRDATTGQLSQASVTTVQAAIGQTETLHF